MKEAELLMDWTLPLKGGEGKFLSKVTQTPQSHSARLRPCMTVVVLTSGQVAQVMQFLMMDPPIIITHNAKASTSHGL